MDRILAWSESVIKEEPGLSPVFKEVSELSQRLTEGSQRGYVFNLY